MNIKIQSRCLLTLLEKSEEDEQMAKSSSILTNNEVQATKLAAKVMRVTFLIFTIVFILNIAGIFIIDSKIMTLAYLLGSVLLLLPTFMLKIFQKYSHISKYFITAFAVLFVTIVTTTLTYHVVIMYIYAIAISNLYFSKKLNIIATFSTIICVSLGQLLAFNLQTLPDKNFTELRTLITYSIVPRALVLIAVAAIFTMLSNRTASMLSNLLDADEQERVLRHMQKMQEKSTTTADKLLDMVKELAEITDTSSKANEQIVKKSEIMFESYSDNTIQINAIHNEIQDMTTQLKDLSKMNKQIAALSQQVNETTQVNQNRMDSATENMEQIHKSTVECKSIIHNLGEESKQILGIIEVISGISSQTNILALNATIEAARAGEHGKGFAVVAEEIHKLSEQTNSAVENIAKIINQVVTDTEGAVKAMEQSASLTQKGMGAIQEAGASSSVITDSNSKMSEEINSMERIVHMIKKNSNQMAESMEHVNKNVQANYSAIEYVTTATEENCTGTESITLMVDQIKELAEKLREVVEG